MVRYGYALMPLVIVAAIVLLAMPWLALFALMAVVVVAIVTLAALAWAVVLVPYTLSRAVVRRRQTRSGASPRTASVSFPVSHEYESVWQGAPSTPAAVSVDRGLKAPQQTSSEGHVS